MQFRKAVLVLLTVSQMSRLHIPAGYGTLADLLYHLTTVHNIQIINTSGIIRWDFVPEIFDFYRNGIN